MELTLAQPFNAKKDYSGWYSSQKLDGYRCTSDGQGGLISRNGIKFPDSPLARVLPYGICLDGELLLEDSIFESHAALRRKTVDKCWNSVIFNVFDIVTTDAIIYEHRYNHLKTIILALDHPQVRLVEHVKVKNNSEAQEWAKAVIAQGGEGLMLRNPLMLYESKRTSNLVKIKAMMDTEAILQGYEAGKGKYVGKIGSYIMQMPTGKKFKLSGMSDELREYSNAPEVGTVITYNYNELTTHRLPRFPRFSRIYSP